MMMTRRAMLGVVASIPLRPASLVDQSAGLVLDRVAPDPAVSYLLTEFATGREIAARWPHVDDPAPVGSLVKPFTALAFGETHEFHFPVSICRGEQDHCWLPQGHGCLDISSAIAYSCNAYFLELAREVNPEALIAVTERYGLAAPPPAVDPATFIGLGTSWQNSPFAVARAYSELIARPNDPGVRGILAGMALSAQSGTGRGVSPGAYAKTGTAPCIHSSRERGDGYVIALYPTDTPRFNLLVRVHGVPGSHAGYVCGKMRRSLG
jgi:cell division protein FtsI/penicillin-binding protein 2